MKSKPPLRFPRGGRRQTRLPRCGPGSVPSGNTPAASRARERRRPAKRRHARSKGSQMGAVPHSGATLRPPAPGRGSALGTDAAAGRLRPLPRGPSSRSGPRRPAPPAHAQATAGRGDGRRPPRDAAPRPRAGERGRGWASEGARAAPRRVPRRRWPRLGHCRAGPRFRIRRVCVTSCSRWRSPFPPLAGPGW